MKIILIIALILGILVMLYIPVFLIIFLISTINKKTSSRNQEYYDEEIIVDSRISFDKDEEIKW